MMRSITLGDICSFQKGASIPRDNTGILLDIPYLHYGDIYKKYSVSVDIDDVFDSIIKISSDEKTKPEQQLNNQDIVYNLTSETIDDLGKSVIIRNKTNKPFVAGMETTVMRVERRDLVYPPYLNYVLQTKGFYSLLQQYVTGMKVFRVHPRDISRISLDFPPLEEQKWISKLGDNLTDRIDANKAVNHRLATRSATDNSPDIKRGKRMLRKSARCALSCSSNSCCSNIGAQASLKRASA